MFLAGCSSSADTDFWNETGVEALEADIPENVADLEERSDLIFQGRVTGVVDLDRDEWQMAGSLEALGVTIATTKVLSGPELDEVHLMRSYSPGVVSFEEFENSYPSKEYLFYTRESEIERYYVLVSSLGLLEESGGRVTTTLESSATTFADGAKTFEDLYPGE